MSALPRAASSNTIFLVTAKDHTYRIAWYFVEVSPLRAPLFLRQLKRWGGALDRYGTVLLCGYGETPTAEARALMKTKYGWEG